MLLCTNTEHLKEVTHTKHYECYRRCRLQKIGFTDVGPDNQPLRWVKILLEQAKGWFTKPLQSWDTIVLEWEELYFSYRQLFWMLCACVFKSFSDLENICKSSTVQGLMYMLNYVYPLCVCANVYYIQKRSSERRLKIISKGWQRILRGCKEYGGLGGGKRKSSIAMPWKSSENSWRAGVLSYSEEK